MGILEAPKSKTPKRQKQKEMRIEPKEFEEEGEEPLNFTIDPLFPEKFIETFRQEMKNIQFSWMVSVIVNIATLVFIMIMVLHYVFHLI